MKAPTGTFDRFNYMLRPSKQVERKLILESLHRMAASGLEMYSHTYVGMGSVAYTDFILFHRFMYLDRMICAEVKNIPARMTLNQPYGFLDLRMGPIADVVADLNRDQKYLVWLDYDAPLLPDMLSDIKGVIQNVGLGSVLLVTVRADLRTCEHDPVLDETEVAAAIARHVEGFGHLVDIDPKRFTYNDYPGLVAEVLDSQIADSLVGRGDDSFLKLFNFRYADGAQMLTLGGLIDDGAGEDALVAHGFFDLPWIKERDSGERINVPPLTVLEQHSINVRLDGARTTVDAGFELDPTLLKNYVRHYRHYPTYWESLF